jgi:hypothetical protein
VNWLNAWLISMSASKISPLSGSNVTVVLARLFSTLS